MGEFRKGNESSTARSSSSTFPCWQAERVFPGDAGPGAPSGPGVHRLRHAVQHRWRARSVGRALPHHRRRALLPARQRPVLLHQESDQLTERVRCVAYLGSKRLQDQNVHVYFVHDTAVSANFTTFLQCTFSFVEVLRSLYTADAFVMEQTEESWKR